MISRWWRHVWSGDRLLAREFGEPMLDEVEALITAGERSHGCELRFAVEGTLDLPELWRGLTPRQRALEVFGQLRVWDTEGNNGVLLYVLLADHAIEIVADRAIARRVPDPDWEQIIGPMREAYRAQRYREGTRAGIESANRLLAERFPPGDEARNELANRPVTL
ncbi:MAG: TPM domain-containing protein [Burkholderiales bacterium]|nr:MAG: TPM domain-containing protein [Burkholderiales bacterium]